LNIVDVAFTNWDNRVNEGQIIGIEKSLGVFWRGAHGYARINRNKVENDKKKKQIAFF